MYIAFLDAFSDYPIGFKLTKEQFVRKFVEKLKIDFTLSIGAFDEEALAGFVFTSVNFYEGKKTAYNGGTGVRPVYRGHRLTSKIYDYLLPLFRERQIRQCVLEVLTENQRAIKSYESIGFKKTKHFNCFKLISKKPVERPLKLELSLFPVDYPDWLTYQRFGDFPPSFLDSPDMITENLANEMMVEAHHADQCVGYAIFQPSFGRVSQIGVHPDYRNQGIGSKLMQYIYNKSFQKALTVINVNENALQTIQFFEHIGFQNQLNQYEMILAL